MTHLRVVIKLKRCNQPITQGELPVSRIGVLLTNLAQPVPRTIRRLQMRLQVHVKAALYYYRLSQGPHIPLTAICLRTHIYDSFGILLP